MQTSQGGTPTMQPPTTEAHEDTGTAGASRPTLTVEQITTEAASIGVSAPTLEPGQAITDEAATGVTATWRNGVTVTALWSTNETRNAWMHVANLGWKRLYNGRDGAFNVLATLASQARQTGRPVNLREEADGMVYEIYLW